MPLRRPASRMFSVALSSVKLRVAPSMDHGDLGLGVRRRAAARRGRCSCFGMLVAKRSILIFASG